MKIFKTLEIRVMFEGHLRIWGCEIPVSKLGFENKGEFYLKVGFMNELRHFSSSLGKEKSPLLYNFRGEYSKQCEKWHDLPSYVGH